MSLAFRLLLIAIAMIPIMAFSDGLVAQFFLAALAAAALAVVLASARAADVNFVARTTRYLTIASVIPAIWMILQIVPMPISEISHSIWANAREALNQQISEHVSIDTGATINALTVYMANISLIAAGIFVAKDRQRAELLLFGLTAISMLTVIALLAAKSGFVAVPKTSNETLSGMSALGVILFLAVCVLAVERKRTETGRLKRNTLIMAALCVGGSLVCVAGLVAYASLNIGLIVAFGAIAFGSILAIRRVALAGWVTGIFLSAILTAAAMIVLWRSDSAGGLSLFLQFASLAPANEISVAQRILSDTSWTGIGSGTYALLLPIYLEFGSTVTKAPSSIAVLAAELGWPMALFAIAAAVALVATLFRGALVRGRDSFYPAAAAACTIIILGESYCDTSLLNCAVATVGDLVVAIGLAQSRSQGTGL